MNDTVHDWDPRDAAVLADQRAAYDDMRERCPVAHSEFLGWSLFRHADVAEAAADPTRFSSATRRIAVPNGMDDPDHAVYRAALAPYFSAARIEAFAERCGAIASALLEAIVPEGSAEVVGDFVNPYAHQAVCAFMGWPVEHWNRVSRWTHGNQEAAFRRDREAGAALAAEFAGYVTEILDQRRSNPDVSDLMGELASATVEGRPLTNEEIVSALRTWTAGHGTVAGALGIVIHHLAGDPELQDRLRAEPGRIDATIGEILRVDGPLVANNRTAVVDVEMGERTIRAGERVSLMWIAANRDPAAFEPPDAVDLSRDQGDSLLFGTGIHRCLGEPLARMELRVAIQELLVHTSGFALLGSSPPARHVYPSNGLWAIPLRMREA